MFFFQKFVFFSKFCFFQKFVYFSNICFFLILTTVFYRMPILNNIYCTLNIKCFTQNIQEALTISTTQLHEG